MNTCIELPSEEWRQSRASAFYRMHERLIIWARICVVGGKGGRQQWDSDQTRRYFDFTPAQHDAAYVLHIMVGQLPDIRHRLVLPEFYRNVEAESWSGLTPARKAHILADMTDAVNSGIRDFNRDTQQDAPRVNALDFEGVRHRAIRMLVNREMQIPLDSPDL